MAEKIGRRKARRSNSPAHNSIACESCRGKKRRCDRILPVCGQCILHPSQCQYPEQNKRGLPSGYVSKLEARLAETEAALCHVLDLGHGRRTQRQAGGVISGPDSPDNGGFSKGDRVKEWDRWPLQSTRDIQEWYRERIHGVARATSPTSTAYTSASRDTNHYSFARSAARTTSTEVVRETPLERGFNTGHLARELQEGVATLTPAPDASHGVSDGQQASRAAELSESQRNIYF